MCERAKLLQSARGGGTIPPEVIHELTYQQEKSGASLQLKEEVEILEVDIVDGRLRVSLDDGSASEDFDMIWLATGAENNIDHYSSLDELRKVLPVSVVNGLPVLDRDLSWGAPAEEKGNQPDWKKLARERF